MWSDVEFMKLLSTLQFDGQPTAIDANINARHDVKRILTFSAAKGTDTSEVRDIVQRAWKSAVDTYAEALYQHATELPPNAFSTRRTTARRLPPAPRHQRPFLLHLDRPPRTGPQTRP